MRRSLPQLRLEDTEGHQHVIQDQEDSGRPVRIATQACHTGLGGFRYSYTSMSYRTRRIQVDQSV